MNDQGPASAGDGDALEIELIAADGIDPGAEVSAAMLQSAAAALERLGVRAGHVAIEIVDADRIHELNREHRDKDKPTDVLSFPVDGEQIAASGPPTPNDAPLELGDVVICPAHTEDMVEATVHGVLHLCGFDHESDAGEMLSLQDEIVDGLRRDREQAGAGTP